MVAEWQVMWQHCYGAEFIALDATPKKPRKPKRGAEEADLSSPEKPKKPGKRVERAKSAAPLPIAARQPASADLKGPKSSRVQAILEPVVPDVEEAFSQCLLKGKEPFNMPSEAAEDENLDDDQQDNALLKTKRTRHSREVRSRPQCPVALRKKRLKLFLSKKGMTYGMFKREHNRHAVLRKAGYCSDGGYKAMQDKMRLGTSPKCPVCADWWAKKDVTIESVSDFLDEENMECIQDQHGAQDDQDGVKIKKSKQQHWQECVEYINKVPHLKAIEGRTLMYHCSLCTNKWKPEGKTNSIGANPTLKNTMYFINEHLITGQHQNELQRIAEEAGMVPIADEVECPGYNVSNPKSPGRLHLYQKEFLLWANHSPMDQRASHTYWFNKTLGAYFVRNKECTKKMPDRPGVVCCKLCAKAGEPASVPRLVVTFLRQFYAAHLLVRRLFQSAEDVAEFEAEVDRSAFGIYHYTSGTGPRSYPLQLFRTWFENPIKPTQSTWPQTR